MICRTLIILGLAAVTAADAQVCPPDPTDPINSLVNPYCNWLWQPFIEEGDKPAADERLQLRTTADSVLLAGSQKFYIAEDTLTGTTLIYLRSRGGDLRELQLLVDDGSYMLLCWKIVEDACECDNNLFLYLPEDDLLKSVEKPFSLSMRRNLIDRLNKYARFRLAKEDYESTCDVLTSL